MWIEVIQCWVIIFAHCVILHVRMWIEVVGEVTYDSCAYVILHVRMWIEVPRLFEQ